MRRRFVQRLTSAVVGGVVTAMGGLAIATLSGREVDVELAAIIALTATGGWLLLTALLTSLRRTPAPSVTPTSPED